jgi:hypothetical protein
MEAKSLYYKELFIILSGSPPKKECWTLITGDLTEGAPKAISFLETCITAKADEVILQNIADGAYDDLYEAD